MPPSVSWLGHQHFGSVWNEECWPWQRRRSSPWLSNRIQRAHTNSNLPCNLENVPFVVPFVYSRICWCWNQKQFTNSQQKDVLLYCRLGFYHNKQVIVWINPHVGEDPFTFWHWHAPKKGTRNTGHACKAKSIIYMYIHASKVILNLQATLTTIKLRSPPWKWMVLYDGLFFLGGNTAYFQGLHSLKLAVRPKRKIHLNQPLIFRGSLPISSMECFVPPPTKRHRKSQGKFRTPKIFAAGIPRATSTWQQKRLWSI